MCVCVDMCVCRGVVCKLVAQNGVRWFSSGIFLNKIPELPQIHAIYTVHRAANAHVPVHSTR